ncbi:MAG: phosphotransferase, partial [Lachnospiraceae bacterium]|nr:phosphotransferase [Lachnospiraceae bacterium]
MEIRTETRAEKRMEPQIAKYWGIEDAVLSAAFHEETERRVYLIASKKEKYILKGIPDTKPERVIIGNVSAHEYLGNGMGIAPKLIDTVDGKRYIRADGFYYYMMEYIDGRPLEETPQDEYDLGRLAYLLHSLREKDASVPLLLSALDSDKEQFYAWFLDKAFKPEFDAVLDELPDFRDLDQCFIHSDLGPHNAMRRKSGEVVLIDLDDSGVGSRHLDLGWAFIMQFVDFCHATGEMRYRFDLALAFLSGYYGIHGQRSFDGEGAACRVPLTRKEYDLLWHGAAFMHISYMQCYG